MNFAGRFSVRRLMCLLVRQNFSPECERVINKQINLELSASYEYLAMAYYFDRSDVALPGVYRFFKKAGEEEHTHAGLLLQYMNKRGGQILLEPLAAPQSCFKSTLEAMQEAMRLEKEVNEALLAAHAVASENNDPQMCDFLEMHFLQEQVDAMKQIADYITQIERCDKELGSFIFDNSMDKTLH